MTYLRKSTYKTIEKSQWLSLIFCLVLTSVFAQKGRIAPFPQELTVHAGETFDITWWVHPGQDPVAAIDFVLWYDQMAIEPLKIENIESPLNINAMKPFIDREKGQIVYAAFKLNDPWPKDPFPLLKLRLKALDVTGVSSLFHDSTIIPSTSMAFEGHNTLEKADDLKVTILSNEPKHSASFDKLSLPRIEIDEESGLYHFQFSSDDSGVTRIMVSQVEGSIPDMVWETRVEKGRVYNYVINPAVLPPGKYNLTLQTAGGLKVEQEVDF